MRLLSFLLVIGCGTAEPPPEPAAETEAVPAPTDAPAASADTVPTAAGELTITPLYHATLRLEHGGKTIWVDPWTKADLSGPKADIVLITDVHEDHLDPAAVEKVSKDGTIVVGPAAIAEKVQPDVTIANGETKEVQGIAITGVPMYNLQRGPEPGKVFHEKGRGNGYVLAIDGKRVYVAGDTECTPEMKALEGIDVAFVPMNLPYTMTPEEAADCIEAFAPDVLYPYHYGDSDLDALQTRLADDAGIELRRREWYPGGLPF